MSAAKKKVAGPVTWQMTGDAVRYVRAAAIAASKDDARPILHHVHVLAVKGTVYVEATDSHRLHRITWADDYTPDMDEMVPAAWFTRNAPRKMALGERLDLTFDERLTMEYDGDGYSTSRCAMTVPFPNTTSLFEQYDAKPTVMDDDGIIGINPTYITDAWKACKLIEPNTWAPNVGVRKIDVLSPMVFEMRGFASFKAIVMPMRLTWSDDKAATA